MQAEEQLQGRRTTKKLLVNREDSNEIVTSNIKYFATNIIKNYSVNKVGLK